MPNIPCLVLDHDDTVVRSEATINYPFFVEMLKRFRPGRTLTLEEYTRDCHRVGFAGLCRDRFGFSEAELAEEYGLWKEHIRTHIPPPFPGIDRVIRAQREAGGLICVVSHSSRENILRDYRTHFGLEPDAIYGWDYPEHQRKPSPYPLQHIMARWGLGPEALLVVDDLKPAWHMARAAGVPIAFAGWGRRDFPELCREMEALCDRSFYDPLELLPLITA